MSICTKGKKPINANEALTILQCRTSVPKSYLVHCVWKYNIFFGQKILPNKGNESWSLGPHSKGCWYTTTKPKRGFSLKIIWNVQVPMITRYFSNHHHLLYLGWHHDVKGPLGTKKWMKSLFLEKNWKEGKSFTRRRKRIEESKCHLPEWRRSRNWNKKH